MKHIRGMSLDEDGVKLSFEDGSEEVKPLGWAEAHGHPDQPISGMWLADDDSLSAEPPEESPV